MDPPRTPEREYDSTLTLTKQALISKDRVYRKRSRLVKYSLLDSVLEPALRECRVLVKLVEALYIAASKKRVEGFTAELL